MRAVCRVDLLHLPVHRLQAKGQARRRLATDLGRWQGWVDDYTAMEFKNGQACWNGPIRSLKVQVRCGGESKLLKVDEPEVCKYVADFETPGACTAEDARLAQQEVESCAADIEE